MKKFEVYREYLLCGKTSDGVPIYGMVIARTRKEAVREFKERTNSNEVQFVFSSYQIRQAAMGKMKEFFDSVGKKHSLRKLKGKPKNVDKLIKIGSI